MGCLVWLIVFEIVSNWLLSSEWSSMQSNAAQKRISTGLEEDRLVAGTCHIPVMSAEVVQYLEAEQGGVFLDCTLGGAGHSEALLRANESNIVFAFDRDQSAVVRAQERLRGFEERVSIERLAFSELGRRLSGRKFNGILADLGVSSDQLKSGRGFSFSDLSPLDMRMDQSSPLSAQVLVNECSQKELYQILKQGGVGREARGVVTAIIHARPIRDTGELAQIVGKAAAGITSKKKINPATVVFQALRMAVNREIEELEALLDLIPDLAAKQARVVFLTFHSVEDQIVTSRVRKWAGSRSAPANWRGSVDQPVLGKLVAKKAVVPSTEEVAANPAARSARLRAFEFA